MFFLTDPKLRALKRGACVTLPEEERRIFFSGKACREAKKVCQACVVRAECLDVQLEFESRPGQVRHGVWGGLTARERDEIYGPAEVQGWEEQQLPGTGPSEDALHQALPGISGDEADWLDFADTGS